MIILQQGSSNQAIATCSRNKNLAGSVNYLWTIKHKLSNQSWQFIPYRIIPITSYEPSYDIFNINIYLNTPQVFIGSINTPVNLHLIPGEYYLKIYEQYSPTNLNPSLSYDVVYEGTITVKPQVPINEVAYTGTTDVFVVYQN
jgi:hypothetical protein